MQIRKIVKLFWSIIDPLSIGSKAVYQKALRLHSFGSKLYLPLFLVLKCSFSRKLSSSKYQKNSDKCPKHSSTVCKIMSSNPASNVRIGMKNRSGNSQVKYDLNSIVNKVVFQIPMVHHCLCSPFSVFLNNKILQRINLKMIQLVSCPGIRTHNLIT